MYSITIKNKCLKSNRLDSESHEKNLRRQYVYWKLLNDLEYSDYYKKILD